jgi:hypothetical protein
MENVQDVEANAAPARECCAPAATSGRVDQRTVFIGLALAGGAGALVLGWDWLVAAGVASIIIAVAPCLVMCALGLCMRHTAKADGTAAGTTPTAPGTDAQAMKARPVAPGADAQSMMSEPVSEPNMTVSESRA